MSARNLVDRILTLELPATDEPLVPPPEITGFFIRWMRGWRQWKQNTLASYAGVSLSTVERIERGEKISDESLDRIGVALGYEPGYFTAPRKRRSPQEAAQSLVNTFEHLEPVQVAPLHTERHIRELLTCHAFLLHEPDKTNREHSVTLFEWLDLATYLLDPVSNSELPEGRGRRELYRDILDCVRHIESEGYTVLCGAMAAPQPNIPEWKVAIISITPKASDPGAPKRKVILVDRRNVSLPGAIDFDALDVN